MQDAKEEVRSRLNIEDVVGEYVRLKRAGRSYKGMSPFTQERTPSFFVSPDKHIWHDFSSGKGGDVFSFVMEVEGLDFRGALELLARKAGVDLSAYQQGADKGLAQKKRRLYEALELAAKYYQHCLVQNAHALEYVVKKRRLNKQVIQDFQIGYAPTDGQALGLFLQKRGFSVPEMIDAGLVTKRYQRPNDMFRGRMMVPLADAQGRVIGFTARLIADDDEAPKYINTPQTLLYDKSRHVFGLHLAKEAIRKEDAAVIVEGNLDVVSSHQAGVKQVVATAGTAMTEQHLRILKRLTENVRLSFDGDKAGIAATERTIPLAQEAGVRLSIISLPDGAKDPDELIQQSAAAWQQATTQARPVVDWVIENYKATYDLQTGDGVREFNTKTAAIISSLQDPLERDYYERRVIELTGASRDAFRHRMAQVKQKTPVKRAKVTKTTKDPAVYQDTLLALCLKTPLAELTEAVSGMFTGEHRQMLARYLAKHQMPFSGDDVPQDLHDIEQYVTLLPLRLDERYAAMNDDERRKEALGLIRKLKIDTLNTKIHTLNDEQRHAETERNTQKADKLRKELNQLIKELAHAKKQETTDS